MVKVIKPRLHGKTYTNIVNRHKNYKAIYSRWRAMRNRCYMKNSWQYKNYGGRGIGVCIEWRYTFEHFYYWALANGFDKSLYLDRVDNNNGYSPENCRWVTVRENNLNQRKAIFLTINGVTKGVIEWSEISGVSYSTLRHRIKVKWPNHELLSSKRKNQFG